VLPPMVAAPSVIMLVFSCWFRFYSQLSCAGALHISVRSSKSAYSRKWRATDYPERWTGCPATAVSVCCGLGGDISSIKI
jgi:hypothetical protein